MSDAALVHIRVGPEDFSQDEESERLRAFGGDIGALVTFSGLVRSRHEGREVRALTLEHYPGMTEKSLRAIVDEACSRWPLLGVSVIHRVGELAAGERIVFVGTSSAHRQAAFEACEFIMDFLKTRAPFWKKCHEAERDYWVEAKTSDEAAAARWRAESGV